MSLVITAANDLNQVAPPALPLASDTYNRQYHDQLNNVLRLYFNRIQSFQQQLNASEFVPALTNFVVADLPDAAVAGAGARSFVTDADTPAFGSAVVGGGAVAVPVYSDGTDWRVG